MLKLSIIIPVYNSEKYLQNCLESVFRQDLSYADYEVIVINDGSDDRSKEIIEKFAVKYPHIVFINQENQGVSAARNAGLDFAKGNYITFVDSDDYLVKDSLKSAVCYLEEKKLDVLYCKIQVVQENGTPLYFMTDTGKEGEILDGFSHPRRTYPAVFYRREMVLGLRFEESITIGEDTLYNAMAQSLSKKVSYSDQPYYVYRSSPTSISSTKELTEKAHNMYLAIKHLLQYRNENFAVHDVRAENYFNQVLRIFIGRIIQWSLLPYLHKENFLKFQAFIAANQLNYLLSEVQQEFPCIQKGYSRFYLYHMLLKFKNKWVENFRINILQKANA